MGGNPRLARDARLRDAGHRRPPRVPVALRADIGRVECRGGAAIAGIDVGEKFLDVAVADPAGRSLKFTEIDLRDMRVSVVDAIAAAMAAMLNPSHCWLTNVLLSWSFWPFSTSTAPHRVLDIAMA